MTRAETRGSGRAHMLYAFGPPNYCGVELWTDGVPNSDGVYLWQFRLDVDTDNSDKGYLVFRDGIYSGLEQTPCDILSTLGNFLTAFSESYPTGGENADLFPAWVYDHVDDFLDLIYHYTER